MFKKRKFNKLPLGKKIVDMKIVFLIYSLSFYVLSAQVAQDTSYNLSKITERVAEQMVVYPQEKIHIHTDRDLYVSGEKIWFKAYLIDACTHLYPTLSRYVYVELISPDDSLVCRVMIRPENDMFYGYLPLTELIPEGDYTLRAYTRYMENTGDDYFFKKNIRIRSLTSPQPSPKERERKGSDDFEVSFFPEGGNLPEGVFCRVAFKALNSNGYPESITGEVVDEHGVTITSVQTLHAGMGMFTYIPDSEKKFYLLCRNEKGLEKQFEMPQPNPRVYSLTASWRNFRLIVEVQQSIHAPDIPYYLLIHCRGTILYFSTWDKDRESVSFSDEQLPCGVIQLILFDSQMNPLSERLVFNPNYDYAAIEFQTDKPSYGKRDKVISTLLLTDAGGNILLPGHLSVAITDDREIAVDESTTILSSLLLSSELRGYIENPSYYLQDNPESTTALDYLMMTHGWRRYNIPEVAKGNREYPSIPYQVSQTISGRVKNLALSRPVNDSEVSIMMNEGFLGLTSTEKDGSFLFLDFEYPDSTSYFIQALNRRGGDRVELVIDNESFPYLVHAPQSRHLTPALSKGEGVTKEETKSEGGADAFMAKAELRSRYDDDMRMINLPEIEVTAQSMDKRDDRRLRFPMNEHADVTIQREVFERVRRRHVADYLASIPGISVTTGQFGTESIRIAGVQSFLLSENPLIVIDGVTMVWESQSVCPLDNLSVEMIESIDVFKGSSASIFGARGTNGVVSVTTKGGLNMINLPQRSGFNYTVYTPLGYQRPVEFYSPQYETLEAKHLTIPDYRTTIFWKPDIVVSDEGEATLEFYASDFPTTYSAVIEGLTTDGRIVRKVEKIRIE